MADPMDFFFGGKPIERKTLVKSARRQVKLSTDLASIYSESETSTLSTCGGTEYVDEYLKKEDTLLRQSSQLYRSVPGANFDQISLTTMAVGSVEVDENLARVYKSYNLTYTAKTNLPITSIREKIMAMIETNPVTIIQGPTGCGKTTQVPQFILDSCYSKNMPCNIIVTQPRRIAAVSIAKHVGRDRNWPVGSLVGYRIGLLNHTGTDTRLTYCTTGVLLQRLVRTKHMNDFTHVIVDEVHERDQDMDFLLMVIRKFLRSNSRGVRVILMSATFNVEKFSKYFSFYAGPKLIQAPIIDVDKSNFFLVREFHLDDIHGLGEAPMVCSEEPQVSKAMMQFAVRLIIVMDNIDKECSFDSSNGDARPTVLVFLPGIYEIEEMHMALLQANERTKWDILVLHSSITNEEQERIFQEAPAGHRRVILSTNITESSVTVPNVKYVIDFCLTKQLVTDPSTNFHSLELTWASKANCQQRAGRTGRVMDGRVYRLVPKYFYESVLPDENPPEIVRAPLENVFLKAKMIDMGKPEELLALSLDPPNLSNLYRTVLLLKETGALLDVEDDPMDGELTDLGRVMGELPLEIHISKLIALGHVFSVLSEAIIIGASMSLKSMFSTPFQKKLQAYEAKLLWAQNTNSDGITFYNAYRAWMTFKANRTKAKSKAEENAWAQRHYLQIKVLREVQATVDDITLRLGHLGIKETRGQNRVQWSEEERQFIFKIIIAGAFYPQYFFAQAKSDDRTSVKELGGLDPAKTVYLAGWPVRQPGMLYAKRFQDIFQEVLTSGTSRIGVKFDHSNRVYIQFNKTEVDDHKDVVEMPGEIPLSVYRALKMRSIGRVISIPIMDVEASIKRADELGVEKEPQSIYLPREKKSVDKSHVEIRPVLPALEITHIPIDILRVIDPGHFWVRTRDEETDGNAMRIRYLIDSNFRHLENLTSTPKPGDLVVAPYEVAISQEEKRLVWERAVVQMVAMMTKEVNTAQVFFIDSGRIGQLRIADLRAVPKTSDLTKIPALAFQCVLSHVKPAILNTLTGLWSNQAKKAFLEAISGDDKKIFGKVYSVVNSVVSVNLIVTNQAGEQLDVNDYLVRKGLAECREEDYLSRYNHSIREDVHRLSPEEKFNHEDLQHSQLYLADSYVDPPSEEDCGGRVTLTGPFSPMEMKLTNLIGAGVGLKINIDGLSVNTILLDPTLTDLQRKLVVAGSVNQSRNSSNLTLRNTTVMPNIPGLTSLLALIFAPKIELRANYLRTRNIGALCGLGYDQKTRKSLFPEHDMVIDFDVDINIDDLQNINRLRYWISLGIFVNCPEEASQEVENAEDAEDAIKCQLKVKEILFDLIYKERDLIKSEVDLRSGKWCRYDDSAFIEPADVTVFKKLIFKLHRALDLNEKDDAREFMLNHLQELREKAAMRVQGTPFADIECRLCNQMISGILQLRAHINSPHHCVREEKFNRHQKI